MPHFRAEALRAVGCWDPFNVTEDADLGIRLARNGYRTCVSSLPTSEEAPISFSVWYGQRKRWLKGWIQTVLVHMRNPGRTCRDLGWGNFAYLQILLTFQVVSFLFHPVFVAIAAFQSVRLFDRQPDSIFSLTLLGLTAFNLVGGYCSYVFLALAVRQRVSRTTPSAWLLATVPIYWLLISMACWGAVGELIRRPFHWEKTQHGLAKSCESANIE